MNFWVLSSEFWDQFKIEESIKKMRHFTVTDDLNIVQNKI